MRRVVEPIETSTNEGGNCVAVFGWNGEETMDRAKRGRLSSGPRMEQCPDGDEELPVRVNNRVFQIG